MTGGSKGNFEHTAEGNRSIAASPRSSESEHKGGYISSTSTPRERTCGSKGRDCEGLTPDLPTGRDKKNPWNGQEAEADNKEEDQKRYNRDGDKKTTPSLGSTKKRRPCRTSPVSITGPVGSSACF